MNLIATTAAVESLNRTSFKRDAGCEEDCRTTRLFEGFVRVQYIATDGQEAEWTKYWDAFIASHHYVWKMKTKR
ncbi:hypothetical protein F2Q70_00037095 [Brassica cretica]|uniref:Uncharacterized protein n=1 Tax=Brassica cretica TaxID=69181 RepID=A0A8S9JQV7_BRACR|nr:hypothetical protein F2Q70_00037095 [Brassica cretica]